jgi:hypothetical protein
VRSLVVVKSNKSMKELSESSARAGASSANCLDNTRSQIMGLTFGAIHTITGAGYEGKGIALSLLKSTSAGVGNWSACKVKE